MAAGVSSIAARNTRKNCVRLRYARRASRLLSTGSLSELSTTCDNRSRSPPALMASFVEIEDTDGRSIVPDYSSQSESTRQVAARDRIDLSIHNVEDVAVRILEPGDFQIVGEMNVALAPHTG